MLKNLSMQLLFKSQRHLIPRSEQNQEVVSLVSLLSQCAIPSEFLINTQVNMDNEKTCLVDKHHRMIYPSVLQIDGQNYDICISCTAIFKGLVNCNQYWSSYQKSFSHIFCQENLRKKSDKVKKDECINMLRDLQQISKAQAKQIIRAIKNQYQIRGRLKQQHALELYKLFVNLREELNIKKKDFILEFFKVEYNKDQLTQQKACIIKHFASTTQIHELEEMFEPEKVREKFQKPQQPEQVTEDVERVVGHRNRNILSERTRKITKMTEKEKKHYRKNYRNLVNTFLIKKQQ